MPRSLPALAAALLVLAVAVSPTAGQPEAPKSAPKDAPKDAPKSAPKPAAGPGFLNFRSQEIDRSLKVGYAVQLADVNADGKPDVVVVDTDKVVWYENPTWQKRLIADKQPRPDNVCIAAADIDGDGKLDFVVGAGWKPFDSRAPGALQWLKRRASLDEPWEVHPIPCEEPTVHRIRFADLDGDGKPELVLAPLMGRDATRAANWMDGRPVRIVSYRIPADPVAGPWTPTVLDESLHVVHNLWPVASETRKGASDLLAASYEGVTLLSPDGAGKWSGRRIGEGQQLNPLASHGSSEVKDGKLKTGKFVATVDPWHGNQVVVYTPGTDPKKVWDRRVLDSRLRWGHAVWCADLDGDGEDELVIGVRDDPARGEDTDPRGVRVYRAREGASRSWERQLVDPGGVAVEDLAVADLDGDGRPDIVAVGRQTGNVRIYWNQK